MPRSRSRRVAVLAVIVLAILPSASAGADLDTPTGGVTAAFEAASSGGLLAQMDFFACVYAGGANGGSFSSFFSGLGREAVVAAGLDPDEFLGAFRASSTDFSATEVSRAEDRAVVRVRVTVTLDADRGRLRDIVRRYAEAQGRAVDDAQIDAAILRQVGPLPQSQVLEHDVVVVLDDGIWVVCPAASTTAATPAAPAAWRPLPPGWLAYPPSGGDYSVAFPGTPTATDRSLTTPQGLAPVHEAALMASDQKSGFYMLRADYPSGYLSSLPTATALDQLLEMVTTQFVGTIESQSDVTVDMRPGRRFILAGASGRLHGLVVVDGDRLYLLLVGGPDVSDPDAEQFLASLAIARGPS